MKKKKEKKRFALKKSRNTIDSCVAIQRSEIFKKIQTFLFFCIENIIIADKIYNMKIKLLAIKFYDNRICIKSFVALFLACVFLFSVSSSFFVYAENEIDQLVEEVEAVDAQLAAISKERFDIDQRITAINAEIPGIKAKNEELTHQLENGKNEMEARLRVMYMHTTDDILQLLFSSVSFSDFISRVDLMMSVFRSDREQLNALKLIQADIEKNETQLANNLKELTVSKEAVVEKEKEMTVLYEDRQSRLHDARVAAAYQEAMRAAKEKEAQTVASSESHSTDAPTPSSGQSETSSSESSQQSTSGHSTQQAGASDFDMICAIVRHEGGASYEGSLGVISCVMNRVDVGWGGNDALSVLTAPYQFESYTAGYYKQFLGADIPETRRAVTDCMEGGIRSHNFLSFRSYETPGSVNIRGNWYFNPMN